MIRIFCTVLAGLLGLAFGSFLNVCLSRWPEGESVVKPRSHCRNCGRTLTWWENVPLVSWIALRGRCRTCKVGISWRYPVVETLIGFFFAAAFFRIYLAFFTIDLPPVSLYQFVFEETGKLVLLQMLVGLCFLDAEHLWLPDIITLPGIFLGLLFAGLHFLISDWLAEGPHISKTGTFIDGLLPSAMACALSGGIILLIRWTYWLIRRREGIGLGDAKLMAMLGAWLGLSGALLSFGIGVVLGALFSLIALANPSARRESDSWLATKLPLGTFLCVGGIVSALWGQPIIEAYRRWAGF